MLKRNQVTDVPTALNKAVQSRLCVHAATGNAPGFKRCANNYDCGACAYDQMLDDTGQAPTSLSKAPERKIRAA